MIPASLQHIFDKAEGGPVSPEPRTPEPGRKSGRLRMVVLQAVSGRVQVIHTEDRLLDIDRLNTSLARECQPLTLQEIARLRRPHKLYTLPPLPTLTGLETVVDESVRELPEVCFDDGSGEEDLTLSLSDYEKLVPEAHWIACTRALTDIPVNLEAPEEDEKQLKSALQQFTSLRIQQRLDDTLDIPPLPETAQRILHLRMNPNAEVGDLADVVEGDPSLAAQVVSWASSSFYASQTPVKSIYDAIMRVLGFELVMNLAMGLSLGRTLKQPKDAPDGFIGYWNQAIWMAQATGTVVGMMPRRARPEFGLAYLSGLLHNFGYLVLAHVFPPHFSLICRYTEANQHVDSSYVEHHLIDLTREQIGSQLMQVWNMPEPVVVAMRQQKNPYYQGEHAAYAKAIYLARALLIERSVPLGPPMAIPASLYEELGVDPEKLGEEMDMLVSNASDVATMAGMMAK